MDKAADASYTFLFGRDTNGKPVNEITAMQATAIYACVRILSDAIVSLPIYMFKSSEYHLSLLVLCTTVDYVPYGTPTDAFVKHIALLSDHNVVI